MINLTRFFKETLIFNNLTLTVYAIHLLWLKTIYTIVKTS